MTERGKKLNDAIDKHKEFKLMLSDEEADALHEELFGEGGLVDKINAELNRRIAVATRFGTPEEKKKKEHDLRHKLSVDFPLNMLRGKRDKNKFIKLRDKYKKHLENSLEYIDVQAELWNAFSNNMKKGE